MSVAPPRGGGHFLCCCKESNQRKQLAYGPRSHVVWPLVPESVGCLKSALTILTGLGSRTHREIAPFRLLAQHLQAPARFAADGSIGSARAFSLTLPSHRI